LVGGLKVVFDPSYEVDIGPHVFPTRKYRLVRDRLLAEEVITESDLVSPQPASDEELALAHTPEYLQKVEACRFTIAELMLLEIPFSPEVGAAARLCAGGSIATARLALERGVAVHLGGGFHHAFADHGEGFCVINDVAVAIRTLQHAGEIRRAAVIDCDVHHGNGTAAIFAAEEATLTFSIHQEHNYPLVKPPSDLDVGLADGTGDEEYLARLAENLSDELRCHAPDLAFYLAGADPYREDQLGGLGVTLEGLAERDAFVLGTLRELGVPAAIVLAGGYAWRPEDTVAIHCATVRAALAVA
jgi:acetoin utilization deacetylase AcuC-like enzyme